MWLSFTMFWAACQQTTCAKQGSKSNWRAFSQLSEVQKLKVNGREKELTGSSLIRDRQLAGHKISCVYAFCGDSITTSLTNWAEGSGRRTREKGRFGRCIENLIYRTWNNGRLQVAYRAAQALERLRLCTIYHLLLDPRLKKQLLWGTCPFSWQRRGGKELLGNHDASYSFCTGFFWFPSPPLVPCLHPLHQ